MAYNRYRKRDKYRRQYTFTRTKAVIGFLLSVAFSITMSAYFDRYESFIVGDAKAKLSDAVNSIVDISHVKPKVVKSKKVVSSKKIE